MRSWRRVEWALSPVLDAGYVLLFLKQGGHEMLPMGNHLVEGFAQIRVIGVGGGGSNAVNRMIQSNMVGIEFIAVNTDPQAFFLTHPPPCLPIEDKFTPPLCAAANPGV